MVEAKELSLKERIAVTYRNDLLRSPFYGILEAGWTTFVLLIAIRHFDAPESYKALIAAASPIGFLLTPLTLYFAVRQKWRPSRLCAYMFFLTTFLILGASVIESLLLFTVLMMSSQIAAVQQGPLVTQIYAENYPASQRGSRIAIPFMLISLSAILFSLLGGRALDQSMNYYRWLLWIMAFSAIAYGWIVNCLPSSPLSTKAVGNPWQNLSLVWKDRFFGYLLGSWMLLGLGHLIAVPIRVEYLANPDFGINADNLEIAFLLAVVPSVIRILSTRLWGHIFDRFHLITTRNLLSVFSLIAMSLFFFAENIVVLTIAMVFFGLSMGGGKIIWQLWVTKIAPSEKVSAYMSVHMVFTGMRGTFAPFIGYWILGKSNPQGVALTGMCLIFISFILFECLRNHQRFADKIDSSLNHTV